MSIPTFLRHLLFRVLRTGFRLLPLPTASRDRLRQRFLERYAGWIPQGPRGQAPAGGAPRRPQLRTGSRVIGYRDSSVASLPDPLPATLIAFYLPQFHPIPENDRWWGEGFTEWHNVARALPQFEGHHQPRLPAALGYYDLRLPQVMRRQMALARQYGIGAFCSYFYWFAGQTLLEQPLRQWLDDPTMDLPICLCWANENWSRRWDGRGDQVLIAQQHSAQDDLAFISHVAAYLRDPRYLCMDGKPILLVYRPGLLPEPAATATRWRQWCTEHGIGAIHLAYVQSFDNVDPRAIGFDSAVAFPPNNTSLPPITAQLRLLNPDFRGDVYDWRELARAASAQADPPYPLHPGVTPGWDNEPRRSGAGRIFLHSSPRGYRDWLRQAISTARGRSPKTPSPPVFINAWNEWAEGAVLEPDMRLGHAWLQATRDALQPVAAHPTQPTRPYAVVHAWYTEVLGELLQALRDSGLAWRTIITTSPERERAVRICLAAMAFDAEVAVFENRGRDVLPFLQVADHLLDESVDVVLKLHTKRSAHRRDGDTWRREVVDKLLAPERAGRIFEAFQHDSALGLVAAEGHVQPLSDYRGANEANVTHLRRCLGMAPATASDQFIAGSMFWVRLIAIRPLLDSQLDPGEFEDEAGQIDGTMAHAVERAFTLVAAASGMTTRTSAAVCGQSHGSSSNSPFPYAARSD